MRTTYLDLRVVRYFIVENKRDYNVAIKIHSENLDKLEKLEVTESEFLDLEGTIEYLTLHKWWNEYENECWLLKWDDKYLKMAQERP